MPRRLAQRNQRQTTNAMNTPLLLTQSLIQARRQCYLQALNLLHAKAVRLGWSNEAQEAAAEIGALHHGGQTGSGALRWCELARLRAAAERDLLRLSLAQPKPAATGRVFHNSLWTKITRCLQGAPAPAASATKRQAAFPLSLTSSTVG